MYYSYNISAEQQLLVQRCYTRTNGLIQPWQTAVLLSSSLCEGKL